VCKGSLVSVWNRKLQFVTLLAVPESVKDVPPDTPVVVYVLFKNQGS
jgi:hypothetical protein